MLDFSHMKVTKSAVRLAHGGDFWLISFLGGGFCSLVLLLLLWSPDKED